ncbi:AzlC family ABC transporter permease [Salinarimonas ramus]|uniref:Branched-chain amino acid ABC transporter permease n=1 Tax=Salinarimonas ramus TaxID=690164 RepID=A0A917V445_9HYPH|nr:AzlC family ABC transporter permease [Salinarimonas ramus]GGK33902.1 branched-chain amino acid ABC transporter permease [Salinarimonas ramus]
MPDPSRQEAEAPPLTLAGALTGMRLTLPLVPGVVVFGTAFGAAAAQKGFDVWLTLSLSAFVFAGASQMVALELWREVWSWPTLLYLMMVTATINGRMVLMGAAIAPHVKAMPRGIRLLNFYVLVDANWLVATRYHADGGRDLGVILGAGAMLWGLWVLATIPGFLAGALVTDPRAFGLDLVMPVFFAVMLVPLWKGLAPAIPWIVAGAVALLTSVLVDGYAFIIVGALAGAAAGALRDG